MFLKVPNKLFDFKLSPTAIKVYLYLLRNQNCLGNTIIKLETICKGCCIGSKGTVLRAITELEQKVLVVKYARRNRDNNNIANGYKVRQIPGSWFKLDLSANPFMLEKSSFAVYLYLLRCSNKKRRCFPSLRHMMVVLKLSCDTVLRAINDLIERILLKKGDYWAGKHNLYILVDFCADKLAQKRTSAVTNVLT